MSKQVVFQTKDFDVTVEKLTSAPDGTPIPPERQDNYFVRHRTHGVAHSICNLYGEVVLMAVALQKGTDAVLENPDNPDLAGALLSKPRSMAGGLN
jgi:hypothetical protein